MPWAAISCAAETAMSDEEIIDKIKLLFALYVPDSLDKRQVLEKLNINLFLPPHKLCLKCKEPLVCPDCEDISVDIDATVRINGRTIYV